VSAIEVVAPTSCVVPSCVHETASGSLVASAEVQNLTSASPAPLSTSIVTRSHRKSPSETVGATEDVSCFGVDPSSVQMKSSLPVAPATLKMSDLGAPPFVYLAISVLLPTGLQSSSATLTRMSMSPVIEFATLSGVLALFPDAPGQYR